MFVSLDRGTICKRLLKEGILPLCPELEEALFMAIPSHKATENAVSNKEEGSGVGPSASKIVVGISVSPTSPERGCWASSRIYNKLYVRSWIGSKLQ